MKIISLLICKLRGHRWGRTLRTDASMGIRQCRRCGKLDTVTMRTPYSRKRDADAAALRG